MGSLWGSYGVYRECSGMESSPPRRDLSIGKNSESLGAILAESAFDRKSFRLPGGVLELGRNPNKG